MENSNVDNIPVSYKPSRSSLVKRLEQTLTTGKPLNAPLEAPAEPPKAVVSTPAAPAPKVEEEFDINPTVAPKAEPAPVAAAPLEDIVKEDPTDEFEQLANEKDGTKKEGHFKKLRTQFNAINQTAKQQATELETLRKKVKDYEEGYAVPDVTAKQLARIQELEKYETLYNLKASPAYQDKFVRPVQSEQEKLLGLAKEYNIDDQTINAALSAGSSAETNRILSSAFGDEVGALEAKSIIRNIRKIQSEAAEAEKEPGKAYDLLREENERIQTQQRQVANERIANTSRSAWSEALSTLREDPRFPEINYKEGDTEHNEKYVRPILTKAGQEYGKLVRVLAENGLTNMPKDVSIALAKMTQLAHQAAVAALERDRLSARVAELENLLHTRSSFGRPSVNNTSGATVGVTTAPTRGAGPAAAARNVLNRVLKK